MDENQPIVKRQFVAVEADWLFIQSVFPEPGFRSYVLGHVVSKLATALKENGIHSFHDRQQRPLFTSITGVLSGIHVTWGASDTNDGARTGGARDENACSEGKPTGPASPPDGEAEKGCGQSGPEFPRPLKDDIRFL